MIRTILLTTILWVVHLHMLNANASLIVNTSLGSIAGAYVKNGTVISYTNIPFAESVSGAYRWTTAKAVKAWNGTLNATSPSVQCIQPASLIFPLTNATLGIEDCLSLDIYVPSDNSKRPAAGWPVFVDIPSGMSCLVPCLGNFLQ